MSTDLVSEAAANLAAWHDLSLSALDRASESDAALWRCDESHPANFFAAVTLADPNAHDDQLRGIQTLVAARPDDELTVCDSFAALDLRPLGFEEQRRGTWFVRAPAAPERSPFPAELSIERVVTERQLAAWEAAAAMGYGAGTPPEPGSWFGKAMLADPRLQVFVGKADGKVVSGSMVYLGDRVSGVYAVSTLPGFRRRRFAEWLTWRAVLARPQQPSVLQPSVEAEPLYRWMGFEPMGEFVVWRHKPKSAS